MEFKNWYKKICPICHEEFETGRGNQNYCPKPACKIEAKRRSHQISNKKRYQKDKLEEEMPKERVSQSALALAEANKEAWEKARTSYGKYEAMKYIEQMRVKK